MREIKFRAWIKENKKMYDDVTFDKIEVMWFDPEARQDPDDSEPGCWVLIGDLTANSLFPQATLMQYTGLKDKNGKEIYEGDLIQNDLGRICKVVWFPTSGCWDAMVVKFSGEEGHLGFENREWPSCTTVIGNIWENPDLLANTPNKE